MYRVYVGSMNEDSSKIENFKVNGGAAGDQWLSMTEAAPLTPYSAEYLSLLARKGKIPSKKVQNIWFTTESAIREYMGRQMARSQISNSQFSPLRQGFEGQAVSKQIAEEKPVIASNVPTKFAAPIRTLEPKNDAVKKHFEILSHVLNRPNITAEKVASGQMQHLDHAPRLRSFHGDVKKFSPKIEVVHEEPEKTEHIERAMEKILDKKFTDNQRPTTHSNAVSGAKRHWRVATSTKLLASATILAVIGLSVLPVPVVFGLIDKSIESIRNSWNDANTVMGFRPGTQANEILLLDKEGNVSIMGHIETEGQLRSYAPQGIAPIVVDSKTTVENFSADSIDNVSSEEFTLAFVTKNGAVTAENVRLMGEVEVGKALLVRGAAKLLSELEVGGGLKTFGKAEFLQAIEVAGPAHFKSLVTLANDLDAKGNISAGKNIAVRGSVEVGRSVTAKSGSFNALGVSGEFSAGGKITLGDGDEDLLIKADNVTLDKNGSAVFDESVSAPTVSADYLHALNATTTNATTTNATSTNVFISNLLTSNNLLLTSSTTLQNLTFQNATGTNATTTDLYTGTVRGLIGRITSIISDDITVGALTATNATTTNATSTSFYVSGLASSTSLRSNTGILGNLTALFSTITNLLVNGSTTLQNFTSQNSTSTNATSTNIYISGLASTTNLRANSSIFGDFTSTNATSSTFAITGNSAGLTFYGTGNHDITAQSGTLRIGSNVVTGNIQALDNTINIGTAGTRFNTIYANEVNATTLVGTIEGGNINANTLTINFDNATADTEDSYITFERGSLTPNVVLGWNSSADRLELNSDLHITTGTGSGAFLVHGSTTLQNFTATNGTTTNATSTNTYVSGLASTTNFRTNIGTIGHLTGGMGVMGNLLVNGSSTLQNFSASAAAINSTLAVTDASTLTGLVTAPAGVQVNAGNYAWNESGVRLWTMGTAASSGNLTLTSGDTAGTVRIIPNTTVGGTLGVTGATTLSSTLGVTGATTLSSSLGVTGAATFSSTINATGGQTTLSNLLLTGSTTLQNFTATNGTTTNATSTNVYFSNALTGPGNFTVNSSGNVGVGTTNPAVKLEVSGIGRFTDTNGLSIGADTGRHRLQRSTDDFAFLTSSNTYADLSIRSAAIGGSYGDSAAPTNGVIIEGNVGINDTTPDFLLDVAGTFNADGNSTIGGTLGVTGAATFSSTINSGAITSTGGISGTTGTFSSNATVGGTLGVTGATTLSSTLGVTGATTLSSTLGVTGAATFSSTINSGAITSSGQGTFSSLHVGSTGAPDAVLEATQGATSVGVRISRAQASGNPVLQFSDEVDNVATLELVAGSNNFTMGSANLTVGGLTSSGAISGTTGTFSGAVTGASYTGGAISGTTGTFSSNATVGGTLGVTGATTLSSTLGVTGATTLSSTLGVTGAATFSSTINSGAITSTGGISGTTGTFSSNATVGGTLGVTGATTLSSTLAVTGNVGIGVASPGSKLAIAGGNVDIAAGESERSIFGLDQIVGFNDLRFYADDTGSTQLFHLGSGTSYFTSSAGNVGIGTTTPAARLNVFTSTNQDGLLVEGSDDNVYLTLRNYDTGGQNWVIGSTGGTSGLGQGKLIFKAGHTQESTINMTMLNSGNVGIGSTNPGYKLDVNGTLGVAGAATLSSTLAVTGASTLTGLVTAPAGVQVNAGNYAWNESGVRSWTMGTAASSGNLTLTSGDTAGTVRIIPNTTVGGTLGVTGATTLSSTLGVTGATTLSSTLGVTGAATFSSNVTMSGNAYTLYGPNSSWGAYLQVGGNGRQYIDQVLYPSVAATDGNLHIDAGSGKDLYLNYYDGANIYFGNGATGYNASVSAAGAISGTTGTFSSNATVGGTLGVTGATTLSSTLNVSGTATFSSGGSFSGAVTMGSASQAASAIGLQISKSTATVGSAPTVRAWGYSPSYELLDKDQVQNWYFGIDDNDSDKLKIGRGYGTNQGVAPAITINTSDNVGIGLTNPSEKFHVSGNTRTSGDYIKDDANGWAMNVSSGGTWGMYWNTAGGTYCETTDADDNRICFVGGGSQRAEINLNNGGALFGIGGGNVGIGTTNPVYKLDVSGTARTSTGSAISYAAGETYMIWNDDPEYSITDDATDANYKTMKTFVASKSGTFKLKFSAYIQAGTYYWAWRVLKNGATVVASGHYNSGLDTGEVSSVHAYRRFVGTVSDIEAGDSFALQMVSSDSSGNPVSGNGQILYAKEFRTYSTTPSVEHGGLANIWGANVGIGTTGASAKLHVKQTTGSLGFDSGIWVQDNEGDGTVGQGPGITLQNADVYTGGIYGIRQENNWKGALAFYTHTVSTGNTFGTTFTEKMRIQDDGNVGIGTTGPGAKLDLRGNFKFGDANGYLVIAPTYGLRINKSDDSLNLVTVFNSGTVAIGTGSGYAAAGTNDPNLANTLLVQGNVGIGKTNPTDKLDVNGSIRVRSAYTNSAVAWLGDWAVAQQVTTNQAMFGRNIYYNDTNWYRINTGYATAIRMNDDAGDGSIAFHLAGSAAAASTPAGWDSTDIKMIIRNGGNVGIGTTNPAVKLEVSGIGRFTDTNGLSIGADTDRHRLQRSTDDFAFLTSSNTYADLSIRSAAIGGSYGDSAAPTNGVIIEGNVGIGTTGPGAKLDIANTSPATWTYTGLAGNYSLNLGRSDGSGVGSIKLNAYSAGQFAFIRPSNGNLHIDSTTGNYYFNWDAGVYGTNAGVIHMANGSGTETVSLNTNGNSWFTGGNVGIGTTGPNARLAIKGGTNNGQIELDNDATSNYLQNYDRNAGVYKPFRIIAGSSGAGLVQTYFDATGVGIGVNGPQSKLHVAGTVSYGSARFTPTSANGESAIAFFDDTAGTDTNDAWVVGQAGWGHTGDFVIGNENNAAGGNVRMLIEKSGNVGIAQTAPLAKLHVGSDGTSYDNAPVARISGNSTEVLAIVGNSSLGNINFYNNGGTQGRLATIQGSTGGQTYGGLLLFFTAADTINTDVVERARIDSAGNFFVSNLVSCGGIQTNASGAMSCTSDERLKDIKGNFTAGLESITKINPQSYSWKDGTDLYDGGFVYDGFIAQDVEAALPEAVKTNPRGFRQVNTNTILAATVNAIKELFSRTVELEQKFANSDKEAGCRVDLFRAALVCVSGEEMKDAVELGALAGGETASSTPSTLDKILSLSAVEYRYASDTPEELKRVGLVAETVESALPVLVALDEFGKKSVRYGVELQVYIVQAIKELNAKAESALAQIAEIKNTILAYAERFVSKELVALDRLCIGSTCINEEQLVRLLQYSGQTVTATTGQPTTNNQQPTTEAEPTTNQPTTNDIQPTTEAEPTTNQPTTNNQQPTTEAEPTTNQPTTDNTQPTTSEPTTNNQQPTTEVTATESTETTTQ